MSQAALWAIVGIALCGLEMLVPGAFLLWIGVAAIATAVATELLTLRWQGQVAAFVLLAVALVGLVAWRKRRRPTPDLVNAPAAGLIGATCTALAFRAGEGRVSFRDSAWQARTTDASTPSPGTVLRIVALEGTTLQVAPSPASSPQSGMRSV